MKRVAIAVLLLAAVGVAGCGHDRGGMEKRQDHAGTWRRPPRPSTLSDPCHDHLEERLRDLLATRDADLTWEDFARLFGPLPAGTFDEVAYFLPLVFRHMQEQRDGFGENLGGFTYWLCSHQADLGRIGATEMVAAELRRTLDAWTGSFPFVHYDEEACRAKGWTLTYDDIVDGSQDLAELVYYLVQGKVFANVAEAFVADLANSDSATMAAWFLEFARWQVEGPSCRVTGAPRAAETEETIRDLHEAAAEQGFHFDEEVAEIMRRCSREEEAVKSVAILRLVSSASLRRQALDRIRSSDLFDPAATYWNDIMRSLDIGR